ncbi:MAG: alpha-hydroxy-acid oxidizing protein [Betaproteobacteria bacterium]|nr:alpha-hydroxy-acid oxidizing protein [Betaproteobacteria bacterium]
MTDLNRCYNIFDLRAAAQRRLPKGIFEYVDKGTEDGISLEENRAAFQRIKLRTRFLNDQVDRGLSAIRRHLLAGEHTRADSSPNILIPPCSHLADPAPSIYSRALFLVCPIYSYRGTNPADNPGRTYSPLMPTARITAPHFS